MFSQVKKNISLILKYVILALVLSVLLLITQSAFAQKQYAISLFMAVAILLVSVTYLRKRTGPMKFITPGVILLCAFVISPIVFTLSMSTYNYKTGNLIGKSEAIERIEALGVSSDENNTAFDISLGSYEGKLALLASASSQNKFFISLPDKVIPLAKSDITYDENFVPISAPGFTKEKGEANAGKGTEGLRFYYDGQYSIAVENLSTGVLIKQNLFYDAQSDTFKNISTGITYVDNKKGNFENPDNPEDFLEPGWRAPVFFANYISLFSDERVRSPLISVTIWTFVFAFLTVLTQFSFGLLLAIALNRKIIGRRIYRSILILPYAMPSIMSILIWGGMFNTEFGAINALLDKQIAWFLDPTFARFAVILVNLWLGFPYFYLVSSGALQAIPSELIEAAEIDGANPRQIFRKVTLPLLLQILTPLLIASFAFNFNNFNLIYLLTGGGPKDTLSGEIAGATDILISYTYQIAFGSNVQNLGLASAISLVIFIIIASFSLYGVKRSKVLESFL